MILSLLLAVALAVEQEFMTTARGKTVQVVFDEASTWYLNAVFFEAVAGVIVAFAVIIWVLRKYGKDV